MKSFEEYSDPDTFDGRFEDKEYAIDVFERNHEAVRRRVPEERFLIFDVREGWRPLCDFLGVEEPEKPFPHLNETKEMQRRLLVLFAISSAVPLVVVVAVIGLIAAFTSLLRRLQ